MTDPCKRCGGLGAIPSPYNTTADDEGEWSQCPDCLTADTTP